MDISLERIREQTKYTKEELKFLVGEINSNCQLKYPMLLKPGMLTTGKFEMGEDRGLKGLIDIALDMSFMCKIQAVARNEDWENQQIGGFDRKMSDRMTKRTMDRLKTGK